MTHAPHMRSRSATPADVILAGIDTHAYILINTDRAEAYTLLFTRFFKTIADVTRKPVSFAYLDHGVGIQTITSDMCNKQATGMLAICTP